MGGEKTKGSKALYFSVLASEALFYSKIRYFRQIFHVLLSGYDTVSRFHWRIPCQCRRALNSLSLPVCEEKRQQRAKAFFDNRFSAASEGGLGGLGTAASSSAVGGLRMQEEGGGKMERRGWSDLHQKGFSILSESTAARFISCT